MNMTELSCCLSICHLKLATKPNEDNEIRLKQTWRLCMHSINSPKTMLLAQNVRKSYGAKGRTQKVLNGIDLGNHSGFE